MRFWDTSAIVPLLVVESTTSDLRGLLEDDPEMAVWWATPVECFGAIARHDRAGELSPSEVDTAHAALGELEDGWVECPPAEAIRALARRLIRVHDIRTADALQLSAAGMLGEGRPGSLPFVTLDDRLALAAQREGFPILP